MKNAHDDNPYKKEDSKDRTNKQKQEAEIDRQLDQTFPASDPPSYSQPGNDLHKREEKE